MAGSGKANSGKQVQIRLKTIHNEYSVPDNTLSVPLTVNSESLNNLVRGLLRKDVDVPAFDFIIADDLLRTDLETFLGAHEELSPEVALDILYVEQQTPPKPKKNVNHEDWVAGVSAMKGFVVSGCYDNSLSIWSNSGDSSSGQNLATFQSHEGPVRAVAWISIDDEYGTFATASHDQVLMLHKWNLQTNKIENLNACKGHKRSVDCIAVNDSGNCVASGSYDGQLKIWSAKVETIPDQNGVIEEDDDISKKARKESGSLPKPLTRTPLMTLVGHKEGISGVTWLENANEVCTASLDHTIKIWDSEIGGMKGELVGSKAFFGLSYSKHHQLLLTAGCERTIRTYDPRSTQGLIVKSAFASHQGWVTCVDWCEGGKSNSNLFISGSHDSLVKMWDLRSYKTPLFDLSGHTDRVLCCNWNESQSIVSGGTDNNMKIFNVKPL